MLEKETGDSYGSLVCNEPKKPRWIIILLCMLAFLWVYTSVAYGADGDFVLDTVTKVDDTATVHYFYKGVEYSQDFYNFNNDDFVIVFTEHQVTVYNYPIKVYQSGNQLLFSEDGSAVTYRFCQWNADSPSESAKKLSAGTAAYGFRPAQFDKSESGYTEVVYSTYDIYDFDGSLFFQPTPWTILQGVKITSPLAQILTVLKTVLLVIIIYLSLWKALKFLLSLIKKS